MTRSEALPGLWLDPAALLAGVRLTLQNGLVSPEYGAFVNRLAVRVGRPNDRPANG